MGTRADFYVGRGEDAEWLGSIAWDGHPESITPNLPEWEAAWPGGPLRPKIGRWADSEHLFDATDEGTFRDRVGRFFQYRDDVTLPDQGWPWPWNDSGTTDYSYAFDDGKVWGSYFGHGWFDPLLPEPEHDERDEKPAVFPDMTARQNVTFGRRSGVMIIGVRGLDPAGEPAF